MRTAVFLFDGSKTACGTENMAVLSGSDGFSKRYGLACIDRTEHDVKEMKRIRKDSFDWYKTVISSNGEVLPD